MIKVFDIIPLDPDKVKVHLACNNGAGEPLDVFLGGTFQQWQEYQTERNFGGDFILSLINIPVPREISTRQVRWLFAGVYSPVGDPTPMPQEDDKTHYMYKTELTDIGKELIGRLVLAYERQSRESFPYGKTIAEECISHRISNQPVSREKAIEMACAP